MVIRMLSLVAKQPFAPLSEDDTTPDRDGEWGDDEVEEGPGDEGEEVSPQASLMRINKQSAEIFNLLQADNDLEEWVYDKLATASDLINSIHAEISYEKKKPDALPQGTETVSAQLRNY